MSKALLLLTFGVAALVLQGLALLSFAEFLDVGRPLSDSVLWQVAAALAAGFWTASAGGTYRDGQWHGLFVQGSLLCLLLPVVGQLIIGSTVLSVLWVPPVRPPVPIQFLQVPRIVPSLVQHVTYGAGLRMRERLRDAGVSSDERFQAMVGLRGFPPNVTGELLRELLSDRVEEIRLLAYGIFEAAENRIRQEILIARQLLDSAKSDARHAQLAARLAELHWELIHQNLVHGELRKLALHYVRQYANESLLRDAKQGRQWYLLGRSALITSEPEEAREYLLRAQEQGFPASRLASWLAEADFQRSRQAATARHWRVLEDNFAHADYELVSK